MTMFTIIAERHGVQIWNIGASPIDALKIAEDRIKSGAERVSVSQPDGTPISSSALKKMAQEWAKARPAEGTVGIADPSVDRSDRDRSAAEGKTIRVGGSAMGAEAEEPAAKSPKQRVRVFKARKAQ